MNKNLKIFILVILLIFFAFFIANRIDLTTADLGRHLKNGEMILKGELGVLNTNFFSYTHTDYPFVNHHWGSGVIFFVILKLFGFTGLSLFYILLSLIVFFLFFSLAKRNSNFTVAVILSLFLIPLITDREEIRPEIFSYLFIGLFFWILWHYSKGLINKKWLYLLPVMGLFWVNLHIYFILGLFLIGVFILGNLKKIKELGLIFILTLISFVFNPFLIKGVLYPLNVFKEYGYKIVENQSVWFLERLDIVNLPNILLFKISFVVLILSFIFALIKKRFSLVLFLLSMAFGVMSLFAIRNFALFGLFALVAIAYNLKPLKFNKQAQEAVIVVLLLFVLVFGVVNNYSRLNFRIKGFGLLPFNNSSANFFKENGLQGPVFNNYDIGSYLIYHLQEKVFVDNRPETYPVSFFTDTYIPLQENWKGDNFNVIFFSHRDYTPWGQAFLIERVSDDSWVPVFVDSYAIIFLKRNSLNKEIIDKYEIPKENFGTK